MTRPNLPPATGSVETTSTPQVVPAPPACAIDPDTECPVCASAGRRVRMHPIKAHYQCPECRYFDSCCM